MIADKPSILGQTIQTEWSLHPEVFQAISTVCFTGSRPQGIGSGCTLPVLGRSGPICLPTSSHLGKVVEKLQDYPFNRIILIAPGWPNMPWFWDLVTMSSQIPLCLPNLVTQPFNQTLHRNLSNLNLNSWLLEQGFSEAVAAQRGSTRSVYEAK